MRSTGRRMRIIVRWVSDHCKLIVGLVIENRLSVHREYLIPGAAKVNLPFECHLGFMDTRLQPEFTIVAGCPKMEGIWL